MGSGDAALFEVGLQHGRNAKGQSTVVAGLRVGRTGPKDWAGSTRAVDAFDAKADVMALLTALDAPTGNLVSTMRLSGAIRAGPVLRLGPNVLASLGELHPKILKAMDLAALRWPSKSFLPMCQPRKPKVPAAIL